MSLWPQLAALFFSSYTMAVVSLQYHTEGGYVQRSYDFVMYVGFTDTTPRWEQYKEIQFHFGTNNGSKRNVTLDTNGSFVNIYRRIDDAYTSIRKAK